MLLRGGLSIEYKGHVVRREMRMAIWHWAEHHESHKKQMGFVLKENCQRGALTRPSVRLPAYHNVIKEQRVGAPGGSVG